MGRDRPASLLVAFGASRALGLAREIGVAYYFGTTVAADRLSAAIVVMTLASMLVSEGMYAGAARVLRSHMSGGRVLDAEFAPVLRAGIVCAAVSAVAFLFAGPLATFAIVGSEPPERLEPLVLAWILAPGVFGMVLCACFNARLTLENRIGLQVGVQSLFSLGALAGLAILALGGPVEPEVVAAGWSAGTIAAALVLARRAGAPAAGPVGERRWAQLRTAGVPLAVTYGLLATQSFLLQALAGSLGDGNVAAYGYADRLFLIPTGFVLAVVGPLVLGSLSRATAAGEELAERALHQLERFARIVIPLALALAAVAPYLVELLFAYGTFDARSVETTQDALDGLVIGIAPVCLGLLQLRSMQAVLPPQRTLVVAGTAVLLTAPIGLALADWLGLFGVTLTLSTVSIITAAQQQQELSRLLGRSWLQRARLRCLAPVLAASAVIGVVVVLQDEGAISGGARLAVLAIAAALAALVLLRRAR
jgi:putative peptidoglycan lipid II flippase